MLELALRAGTGEDPAVGGGDDGGAVEEPHELLAQVFHGAAGEDDLHQDPVDLLEPVEHGGLVVEQAPSASVLSWSQVSPRRARAAGARPRRTSARPRRQRPGRPPPREPSRRPRQGRRRAPATRRGRPGPPRRPPARAGGAPLSANRGVALAAARCGTPASRAGSHSPRRPRRERPGARPPPAGGSPCRVVTGPLREGCWQVTAIGDRIVGNFHHEGSLAALDSVAATGDR